MTADLGEQLATLDGEQVYHLAGELIRAEIACERILCDPKTRGPVRQATEDMAVELTEIRCLVLAQVGRITVPIVEAAKIVYRAQFARHHPVRVPGT